MNSVRLATFNLESLGGARQDPEAFAARISILRPQLMRLEADVLCLQEVDGEKPEPGAPRELLGLARLIEDTPYRHVHLAATQSRSGAGVSKRHNLALLSRLAVGAVAQIRHDLVEPPLYRRTAGEPEDAAPIALGFDRPILHVRLALPDGRALHVFNLHLRAPRAAPVPGGKTEGTWRTVSAWAEGYFVASAKRAAQALELRRAVERVFDSGEALIAACGDFNADDGETALRIASASEGDTRSARLAARALTPAERSLPEDRRYSVVHNGRPEMLDHILVSRELLGRLRDVEVHNETLLDETIALDAPSGSFHAPLVAEFDLGL